MRQPSGWLTVLLTIASLLLELWQCLSPPPVRVVVVPAHGQMQHHAPVRHHH